MDRRRFGGTTLALALSAALPRVSMAQDAWPSKPIRLVVPFPPSGGTDLLSREVAAMITAATKWVFVIDNRPGAGGNIGLEQAAKAPPMKSQARPPAKPAHASGGAPSNGKPPANGKANGQAPIMRKSAAEAAFPLDDDPAFRDF